MNLRSCKNDSDGGFTLVEVLVATALLSIAIMMVNGAFKQFSDYKFKMKSYENLYSSVLSIKDMISISDLKDKRSGSGELNDLAYRYEVKVSSRKAITLDDPEVGELASFEVVIYEVSLAVKGRDFDFFQTRYYK